MAALFELNDQCVTLSGLVDKVSGAFINDATAAVTITRDGVEVGGENWPLSMPYQTGSDGNYTGVIESTVEIVDGEKVTVSIDVTTPAGGNANFKQVVPVKSRGLSGG